MERDNISEFLKKMGYNQPNKQPDSDDWATVIQPNSAYLILGRRGSGKTALGHYLTERFSKEYSLLPAIVGLPSSKKTLLPLDYVCPPSPADTPDDSIAVLDEGALATPARRSMSKINQLVISMLSLVRQRNQIIFFLYHFPRMVDVGILSYLDGVLIKEPSIWDVAYGQKGELLPKLTIKAAELFESMDEDRRKRATFVSAPQAKFEGILENPLPSYWSDEISKAWAGYQGQQLTVTKQPSLLEPEETTQEYYHRKIGYLFPEGITDEILDILVSYNGNYNLEELQRMCKEVELSSSGDKKILAARLLAYERGQK